jgi:hypothetical protein
MSSRERGGGEDLPFAFRFESPEALPAEIAKELAARAGCACGCSCTGGMGGGGGGGGGRAVRTAEELE